MGLIKSIGKRVGGWIVNTAKNAYNFGRKVAPVALRVAQSMPGHIGTIARVAGSAANTLQQLTNALGKGKISDVVHKGANIANHVKSEAEGYQQKANEALNRAGQVGEVFKKGVDNLRGIL